MNERNQGFSVRSQEHILWVHLEGDWRRARTEPALHQLETGFPSTGQIQALQFETEALSRWDASLVVFVLKCQQFCRDHQLEFRPGSLPQGVIKLLQLSQAVAEQKEAAPLVQRPTFLARIGESLPHAFAGAIAGLTFLGDNVLACLKLLARKAQFRWSDTLLVMQECGPEALGIVALINFLIGLIIAFVGATELARFGASIYTADLVAIATVRELGCIMTGIIICGRTGAAFAAQLGTMKVNQEIEAFRTFGFSTTEFLVLPRIVALLLIMPLLCVFADIIAIFGGFLVSTLMLDVTPSVYLHRTVASITITSFLLGIFKGAFFGFVIALTGCLRGMQCGTNAAAVGQATTSAVVTGITAIIASDGVFAVICNSLDI